MTIQSALKAILPLVHAYLDEEHRFNIGATWTSSDGLRDFYNLELRYVHNSERLALSGEPAPDGSWRYTDAGGRVHTISAERAKHFMERTHEHATVMCQMLDKLRASGALNDPIDTQAQAA